MTDKKLVELARELAHLRRKSNDVIVRIASFVHSEATIDAEDALRAVLRAFDADVYRLFAEFQTELRSATKSLDDLLIGQEKDAGNCEFEIKLVRSTVRLMDSEADTAIERARRGKGN